MIASGVLSLVNGIAPWWYRAVPTTGARTYNAGLHGVGALGVLAATAAALVVFVRAWLWPKPAPLLDASAYITLGFIALGTITIQAGTAQSVWIGPYVGIALATTLTLGGFARGAERKQGWR